MPKLESLYKQPNTLFLGEKAIYLVQRIVDVQGKPLSQNDTLFFYKGSLIEKDNSDYAYGRGIARAAGSNLKIEGTWRYDKIHGICRVSLDGQEVLTQEYRDGKKHGMGTYVQYDLDAK